MARFYPAAKSTVLLAVLGGSISGVVGMLTIPFFPMVRQDSASLPLMFLDLFVPGCFLGTIGAILHARESILLGSVLIGLSHTSVILICSILWIVMSGRMDVTKPLSFLEGAILYLISWVLTLMIGLIPVAVAKALGDKKR